MRDRAVVSLAFMFFGGGAYHVVHASIPWRWGVFLALSAILLASTAHRSVFGLVYVLVLHYIVLFVAEVPAGLIRAYNRLGDYSYGIYIYAFPVQQILASMASGIQVPAMAACASILTLALAVASWHAVEKRSLAYKGRLVTCTRSMVGKHT